MIQMAEMTPEVSALLKDGNLSTNKQEYVGNLVDGVADRVIMSYPWDFATDVADLSITADQMDYVMKGKGTTNNCRTIYSIKYGTGTDDSGYAPLEKQIPSEMDKILSVMSVSDVKYWVPKRRQGDFPTVRIIATPTDAAKILRYVYWLKNIGIANIPDGCGFDVLMLAGVRAELMQPNVPGLNMGIEFMRRLKETISNYVRSGGGSMRMGMDPQVVKKNLARSARQASHFSDYVRLNEDH